MANILKPHLRATIETLLKRRTSQREIARLTGIDRKTIRRCAQARAVQALRDSLEPKLDTPAATPPAEPAPRVARSACTPHQAWIEQQLKLGRNAQSIYQDLVESRGLTHRYNAVKRFVRVLKTREPEQFDILEFIPGEECQVDYGQGALTLHPTTGKYKRPYLFVMTLAYSGKAFRKVTWKTDQQIWAALHEQAFRTFGGSVQYVVLDNLKEGVIKPDLYEPRLNPVYRAMLSHYDLTADPCRVRDPNRKGSVENAIKHTQNTALKGRKFESIEAQNEWLAHWEERWAAPRKHSRKKRLVTELYQEERPHLQPLPIEAFSPFKHVVRTVDNAGLVQVDSSYYSALPAALHSEVAVRIYANDIEIVDQNGQVLRRHEKAKAKGQFALRVEDRIFNPSNESSRLLAKVKRFGPKSAELAQQLFDRLGRPGHRALYGIANLTTRYRPQEIEAACEAVLQSGPPSYKSVKHHLERITENHTADIVPFPRLAQSGPEIRSIAEYQAFWDKATQSTAGGDAHADVTR
jgi:transposase